MKKESIYFVGDFYTAVERPRSRMVGTLLRALRRAGMRVPSGFGETGRGADAGDGVGVVSKHRLARRFITGCATRLGDCPA